MNYINEKKDFLENGVVVIRGLFPKATIEECLVDFENFTDVRGARDLGHLLMDEANGAETLKYFQYINVYIKSFNKLLSSKILSIGQFFLEQDVYFSPMGMHNKGPKIGSITPPHQDNFYSCLTPPDFVTAYVPLLPMSPINGGIQYVLGSHKLGVLDHAVSSVKAFSSGLDRSVMDGYKILKPDLKPGDVVFHHGNIIHLAQNNETDSQRYAVAIGIFGENAMVDINLKNQYEKNLRMNRGEG
jgi:phytanoyl-CoA hydroxylase